MQATTWEAKYETTTMADANSASIIVTGRLTGQHDAGYWDTSTMILESAICLATQVMDTYNVCHYTGHINEKTDTYSPLLCLVV